MERLEALIGATILAARMGDREAAGRHLEEGAALSRDVVDDVGTGVGGGAKAIWESSRLFAMFTRMSATSPISRSPRR